MTNNPCKEKISNIFGELPPKHIHISGNIIRSEGDFAAGKAVLSDHNLKLRPIMQS